MNIHIGQRDTTFALISRASWEEIAPFKKRMGWRFNERGIDLMNTTYNFLDLTAKGRDENPDSPQDWVRYRDEYKGASKDRCA